MVITVIRHGELSDSQREEILNIKAVRWPYPYASQIEWMNTNLRDDDLHFCVYEDKKLVAYMNIVNVTLRVNGENQKALGLGNVCTRSSGQGYGRLLMLAINDFLRRNNKIGVLFCREKVLPFYEHFCWKRVAYKGYGIDSIYTLLFNTTISQIEYCDRIF